MFADSRKFAFNVILLEKSASNAFQQMPTVLNSNLLAISMLEVILNHFLFLVNLKLYKILTMVLFRTVVKASELNISTDYQNCVTELELLG